MANWQRSRSWLLAIQPSGVWVSNYAIKRDLRENTRFKFIIGRVGPLFWLLAGMKVSELQAAFLNNMKLLLPDWRFIAGGRHFKKVQGNVTWYFHISCANYATEFLAFGDVAVEFTSKKVKVAIIGAQLANIEGTGDSPHHVGSLRECVKSSESLVEEFKRAGLPFLERYSDANLVLSVLRQGGKEASLISTFSDYHASQIAALSEFTRAV